MRANLIERRSEMLKLRGVGLSLSKIVNDLSQKYGVTNRCLYLDWSHRKQWLKHLLSLKDPETFFLDLLATHREIYKLVVMEFLKADNSNARVGSLRLLRDINKDFAEMVVIQDIVSRLNMLEEVVK